MDKKVFSMALLTIFSAFILVIVIIYATNTDKINALLGRNKASNAVESVEESTEEMTTIESQQIGDDLKSFLYDDNFFDEAEEIPAIVVIEKNTKNPASSEEGSSDISGVDEPEGDEPVDENGSGMAIVGELENPDSLPPMPTP